jgi:hypothetical protein
VVCYRIQPQAANDVSAYPYINLRWRHERTVLRHLFLCSVPYSSELLDVVTSKEGQIETQPVRAGKTVSRGIHSVPIFLFSARPASLYFEEHVYIHTHT